MIRYWLVFLFVGSWFLCLGQNADETGCQSLTDAIGIQGDLALPDIVVDSISEVTNEDPEHIDAVDAAIEDNVAGHPVFVDYKETKYWWRYKTLQTAGWVCFGCGAGFLVGGYALLFAAFASDSSAASVLGITGGVMLFSSPLLIVASIPLLATAYYNRHKAKKLKLDVGVSQIPSFTASPYAMQTPVVSFSLDF